MANVSGSAEINLTFTQLGPVGTKLLASIAESDRWKATLANGTLLDQCNLMHAKTYTLAASTPQTIDLYDGSLLDVTGAACAFRRVDVLLYRVQSITDTHEVLFGGAAATEWLGWLRGAGAKVAAFPSTASNKGFTAVVAPGTAGMVVSSTSRSLKMDPGALAVGAVDLVIVGRNA